MGLNDIGFLGDCFYTDANDTWMYPTMKLVSAITNYQNEAAFNEHLDLPVLTYINNGHSTLLNDWDNPNYFLAAILTLLFFGIGGHFAINDRSKKSEVLSKAWAKWTLLHHS